MAVTEIGVTIPNTVDELLAIWEESNGVLLELEAFYHLIGPIGRDGVYLPERPRVGDVTHHTFTFSIPQSGILARDLVAYLAGEFIGYGLIDGPCGHLIEPKDTLIVHARFQWYA